MLVGLAGLWRNRIRRILRSRLNGICGIRMCREGLLEDCRLLDALHYSDRSLDKCRQIDEARV